MQGRGLCAEALGVRYKDGSVGWSWVVRFGSGSMDRERREKGNASGLGERKER